MDGAGYAVKRVAVLVDCDNVSAAQMAEVLAAARLSGDPAVLRAFGHANKLSAWEQGGFRLIVAGIAKNAADMALTVDAMQLAYEGLVEDFVIVSSDRDFTYLVQHLRLMNHGVTLVCGPHAPAGLRANCSSVHVLPERVPMPKPVVVPPKLSALDAAIRDTILNHGTNGAMPLAALANHPDVRAINGRPIAGKWRAYFVTNGRSYRCDPKGPMAKVHLLNI